MPFASAPRRTGVLIIRAWIEPRSGAIRAHVTSQLDIERGAKEQVGADDPDAVVTIVEQWMNRFGEASDEERGGPRDGFATGR